MKQAQKRPNREIMIIGPKLIKNIEQRCCPHVHEQSFQSMSLATTPAWTPFCSSLEVEAKLF
jgi:hypothetical protein